MMLEDEITAETDWYKDADFVKELDVQYTAWKKNNAKAYTLEEIERAIEEKRTKRQK